MLLNTHLLSRRVLPARCTVVLRISPNVPSDSNHAVSWQEVAEARRMLDGITDGRSACGYTTSDLDYGV
jgi:hypothetical protein